MPRASPSGYGRTAYHDSCYLGRYEGIYEEPRVALSSVPGMELVELPRCRSDSFCCGGGGGRTFLEESEGERINHMRTDEAIGAGLSTLVTACPFCMTMLSDGAKDKGEAFTVLDLAEVLIQHRRAGSERRRLTPDPTHTRRLPAVRQARAGQGSAVRSSRPAASLASASRPICGEKRTCGKCKVRIEDGFFEALGITSSPGHVSARSPVEDKFFTPERRAEGYRLACKADVHGDLVVFVPEEARVDGQVVRKAVTDRKIHVDPSVRTYYVEMEPPTLHDPLGDYERLCDALEAQHRPRAPADRLQGACGPGQDASRLPGGRSRYPSGRAAAVPEIVRVAAGRTQRSIGLAVDVGTTSVAAYLCDLETGEVLAYDAMMNPQVTYGEDVMSRITFAMSHDGGVERLRAAVIEGVNTLAARVAEAAGFTSEDILEMTVVFNTAMHHCFLGIDPEYLGAAPYAPAVQHSINIKARDLGLDLCPGANVYVLPNRGRLRRRGQRGRADRRRAVDEDERQLIIDIGTNGELHHGQQGQALISSSCATGPAFEGAQILFGMRAAPGAIERIYINPETLEPRYKVIGKDAWSDELAPEEIGSKGICGSGIIDGRGRAVQGRHHRQVRPVREGRRQPSCPQGRQRRRVRARLGARDVARARHHDHDLGRAGGAAGQGRHVRRRQDHDAETRLRQRSTEWSSPAPSGHSSTARRRWSSACSPTFPWSASTPWATPPATGRAWLSWMRASGSRPIAGRARSSTWSCPWSRRSRADMARAMYIPHMKDKFANLASVLAAEGLAGRVG